jgi:DNA (cytosine-5)-methyltransferase 1
MKHGSLFSGIGMFDYAAEMMGWENVFNCEIDMFSDVVLKYHYPKAERFYDITKSDFSKYEGKIDIVTGGFPCQPFSASGKKLGKKDKRYLWPAMLRAIKQIKPAYVVAENVFGLTFNGGLVLQQIISDLEAQGYEVATLVLPASAVGAVHQRNRVWIVGFNQSYRTKEFLKTAKAKKAATDTNKVVINQQLAKARKYQEPFGQRRTNLRSDGIISIGLPWATESPICGRHDGTPKELLGITVPKWKEECFKSLGNAIVWQNAYMIFQHLPII